PDRKTLYCLYQPEDDKAYHLERLLRFSWPAMAERTVLTANFDRSVDAFALAPDGKTAYFLAQEAGLSNLYALPAAGGERRRVVELAHGGYTNLAVPAKAPETILLANYDSATSPPEVVRVEPAGGGHRALTAFTTREAVAIDWQPLRHFWCTS